MAHNRSDDEFMAIYVRWQASLYQYLRTLVINGADAEDLFQQTSLTLWQKRAEFDESRGTFMAWATTIAFNHVRNHARKRARRGDGKFFGDDVLVQIADATLRESDWSDACFDALDACLDELTGDQQRLVTRYYTDGLTVPRIAKEINRPVESMYKRLRRVRQLLFECIEGKMKEAS